jgi:hypothetical protein
VTLSRAMIEKLQAAKGGRDDAQVALEDTVIEAWKAGGGIREIGDAVGMTHTGVSKLLERRGVREKLRYEDTDRARRELRGER